MRRLWLILALAGCAAAAPERRPQVGEAILYRDTLTVEMRDGTLCVAPRPPSGAWEGRLIGCPYTWPVVVRPQGQGPRSLLAPAAPGAPAAVGLQTPDGPLAFTLRATSS
ncbi:hypothetical protein [Tranquillimonas alkanivorans]|uniref:Uncharacterized protein n=1 Tax=Tranquillimonas alkanivorans TaxID=441119 RepID=A0A1I5N3Q9_9RHOB|nr:hypothetical protein [Tranquillimonas alkanivorans]SFP16478.1 hypothetical protein SAMN04488047_10384 [Tranquillimonas alkanivorans]